VPGVTDMDVIVLTPPAPPPPEGARLAAPPPPATIKTSIDVTVGGITKVPLLVNNNLPVDGLLVKNATDAVDISVFNLGILTYLCCCI
jgi:hypothetical protein